MKRKLMALGIIASLAAGIFAGCGNSGSGSSGSSSSAASDKSATGETVKVGFVNQTDADDCCYECTQRFRAYCESDEFKEAIGGKNVEVYTADSALDIAKQSDNVETLLTKGVEVMFIIGVDTSGNTTSVNACNAAGVPVYMVGTEADGGDWKFVGFKEYDIGYAQGKYLAENAPDGATVCYLQGAAGREATLDQEEGFDAAIEESGRTDLQILSRQDGKWTAEDAMQITEDWIQTYSKIDYIVSMDGKMASGAVEALKGAGRDGETQIYGVYSMGDWNSKLITDGYMTFAVYKDWPSIGDLCGEVAAMTINGEEVDEFTYFDMADITSDNASEYFG